MAKVWKDHPMVGKRVTYIDGDVSLDAEVIGVTRGPLITSFDPTAPSLPLRGTIKLKIKPADGSPAFWTPPMELPDEGAKNPARSHGESTS